MVEGEVEDDEVEVVVVEVVVVEVVVVEVVVVGGGRVYVTVAVPVARSP